MLLWLDLLRSKGVDMNIKDIRQYTSMELQVSQMLQMLQMLGLSISNIERERERERERHVSYHTMEYDSVEQQDESTASSPNQTQ